MQNEKWIHQGKKNLMSSKMARAATDIAATVTSRKTAASNHHALSRIDHWCHKKKTII
jgi:hypothetical protein